MTTPDDPSIYCRTCKYALNIRRGPGGAVSFEHALQTPGDPADHIPDPVPLAELPDAIQLCDFCSSTASFVYTVNEEHITHHNVVTKQFVSHRDRQEHGPAARVRRSETQRARTDMFGKRWTACAGCATLIEAADLPRLVTRVTESLPAKLVAGNKLTKVRGQLYTNFGHVLTHRQPGRHRITDTAPLGIWEPGPAPGGQP